MQPFFGENVQLVLVLSIAIGRGFSHMPFASAPDADLGPCSVDVRYVQIVIPPRTPPEAFIVIVADYHLLLGRPVEVFPLLRENRELQALLGLWGFSLEVSGYQV